MVHAADAATNEPEQSIVRVVLTIIICRSDPPEAFSLKELAEDVFEHINLQPEAVQVLGSSFRTAICTFAVEEPSFRLLLDLRGRQIGEREEAVTFEVSAFLHELLTALIVDYA